jgi:flagella basal body P-ring formation protein FlgA
MVIRQREFPMSALLKKLCIIGILLLASGFSSTEMASGALPEPGTREALAPAAETTPWRIRFLDAAVVQGERVRLGEVASPVGDMPERLWREYSLRELWPSPPENSKAVSMTRPRLQEAVVATMNDLAPFCLFPGSLALQRGGVVIGKDEVQARVVKSLTPLLGGVDGEASFKDFRIPQQIFLKHSGQTVEVVPQKKVEPGRVNFRIVVSELDGSAVQRISGSVFMDVWANVPCAAVPLNKGDIIGPASITHTRVNLALHRGEPWDGRGGSWRAVRPIGLNQVISRSDIGHIPTVTKGSAVTLLYESKSIRLVVPAEALSDGVAGESIPVRNRESKKEVYGVVHDAQTILVRSFM